MVSILKIMLLRNLIFLLNLTTLTLAQTNTTKAIKYKPILPEKLLFDYLLNFTSYNPNVPPYNISNP